MTLTYRGKPVARLEPVRTEKPNPKNDPIFHIHHLAEASPSGPLNHKEIDRLVYEFP